MARFQDAWLTHQQKRFMRPDAERYVRPDVFRWSPRGGTDVGASERKFDPDQPRVPAGSPEGGQWTADGGSNQGGVIEEVLSEVANSEISKLLEQLFDLQAQSEFSDGKLSEDAEVILVGGSGHHYVPRAVFENKDKYSFSKDALNVFENGKTGPLKDPTSNRFDWMHRQYNDAVEEAMNKFLARNGISSDQVTPEKAQKFVDEIKRSSDPRILQFQQAAFYARDYVLDSA